MRSITVCTGLIFVLMFGAPSFVVAEMPGADTMPDHLVAFYTGQIDKKIAAAERYEPLLNSESLMTRCMTRREINRAEFYQGHRAELIEEMMKENVEMKDYKTSYFLTNSFLVANPSARFACLEPRRQQP